MRPDDGPVRVDGPAGPVPEQRRAAPAAESAVPRGTRFRPALLWSYVVSSGMYVVTALVTFVLAAILGPEQFGLLWMALVWVTLAQLLLQHGPTIAVIQQDNITDRHLDAAFWSTIAGAVVYAGMLAAVAPLWARFNQLPELTALCLALTAIVPLYALNVIPEAVLRRRMQLRGIALRYLSSGLLSGVAAIACAMAGMGVWALVVQQVGMTLTNTVLLWLMISWRPRLRRVGDELRDIRSTSVKTLLGAVGTFVQSRADVLVMGTLFGPVVVGLFRFAYRVPELVMSLAARGLHDVALPDLARHHLDPDALAARLGRLVRVVAVLSVPALGVVVAAAEPFVLTIGDQWMEAAAPMRVLCLVMAFMILSSLFGPALQAAQRPGLPAVVTWVNAVCLVCGIYVAARLSIDAGTVGQLLAVAWALVIIQGTLTLVLGYLVFARVLHVSAWPAIRATVPSVVAGAGAAGTGLVLPRLVTADLPPVVMLLITGTAAGLVAGVIVLSLDREARSWLAAVRPGARGRPPQDDSEATPAVVGRQ